MAKQVGRETSDDGGVPDPPDPAPKAYNPPAPSPGNRALTIADQGKPLPILYGRAKLPLQLIEKYNPGVVQPLAWQATHGYIVGDLVQNFGNVFQCTTAGTSANGSGVFPGPLGTGGSISDNTVVWKYVQQMPYPLYLQSFLGALCEGEAEGGWKLWWDKETFGNLSPQTTFAGKTGLQIYLGPDAGGQALPATYDNAINYQHTVLLGVPLNGFCTSGTQQELPDIAVDIQGPRFGLTSTFYDPSPADVVNDVLTNARRGMGWPGSRVDSSITGTAAGAFRVYCDAAGFRFSLVIDQQRTALQILGDILTATNSDAVWSGGALKIVPLGDQAIASPVYGATGYVPSNVAAFNLGPDDFLDPIEMDPRRSDTDCFNSWPIEYIDRAAAYVKLTVDDPDQVDVDAHGGLLKRAGTTTLPVIFPDGTYVTQLSRILAQRSLKIRNTYTFRLSWKYMLLEPTDIVTLTDPVLGLSATPVRLLRVQSGKRGITCTAEDYPAGVQAAAAYQPAQGDGYKPNEKVTTQIVPSIVDGNSVGIGTGVVPAGGLTSSQNNKDNLWPNPTSEILPPSNVDPTAAEWKGRTNLGGGAYAGDWVREIQGSSQGISLTVPASPGDGFYMEAQCKAAVAGANLGGAVVINALDKTGATLLQVVGTLVEVTAWTLSSAKITCPAATCAVQLVLATEGGGSAHAYFDAIYARRMIDSVIVNGLQTSQYSTTSQPAWQAGHSYSEGSIVTNVGNLYYCTAAGVSAGSGGPTGTSATTPIADNTAYWVYLMPGTSTPSAGAKLDSQGTAVLIAPSNLIVGVKTIDKTWPNFVYMAGARCTWVSGSCTLHSYDEFNCISVTSAIYGGSYGGINHQIKLKILKTSEICIPGHANYSPICHGAIEATTGAANLKYDLKFFDFNDDSAGGVDFWFAVVDATTGGVVDLNSFALIRTHMTIGIPGATVYF